MFFDVSDMLESSNHDCNALLRTEWTALETANSNLYLQQYILHYACCLFLWRLATQPPQTIYHQKMNLEVEKEKLICRSFLYLGNAQNIYVLYIKSFLQINFSFQDCVVTFFAVAKKMFLLKTMCRNNGA